MIFDADVRICLAHRLDVREVCGAGNNHLQRHGDTVTQRQRTSADDNNFSPSRWTRAGHLCISTHHLISRPYALHRQSRITDRATLYIIGLTTTATGAQQLTSSTDKTQVELYVCIHQQSRAEVSSSSLARAPRWLIFDEWKCMQLSACCAMPDSAVNCIWDHWPIIARLQLQTRPIQ